MLKKLNLSLSNRCNANCIWCPVERGTKHNFDLSYDSIVKIIEEVEKLEQLRWLKNGLQIGCLSVYYNGVEINAPGDVIEWQQKNLQ